MSNSTQFRQALANVLESSEKACWELFETEITDEGHKQRVIGQLEGIEKVLTFIDTELTILTMEEHA